MIRYDFAQIAQAATDIQATNGRVGTMMDQLKQDLAPMVAEWQGDSADAYQAAQRRWDAAAEELNAVLSTIARAVGDANDRMARINTSAANSWA
ncbi:WXG100 family type VII secretion target [Corynebacterium bovis]|uniref:WXG100 family type VII secretion target n=1 Tax=Corynebacterium bovis TaxID=36808 RepID=UPI00313948C9